MKNHIDLFKVFESKFSKLADRYIESDYTPNWKDTPQRYSNFKDSKKLQILQFIFEAGEEGRSYGEIQRFYYKLGANEKGERLRYDADEYKWDPVAKKSIVVKKGKGSHLRGFDPVKDRGRGTTMLIAGDWHGSQTGILHAHCKKNENGKWVLIDRKLIQIFKLIDIDDEGDIDMIRNLGLLD
jgi:hypothetical protein